MINAHALISALPCKHFALRLSGDMRMQVVVRGTGRYEHSQHSQLRFGSRSGEDVRPAIGPAAAGPNPLQLPEQFFNFDAGGWHHDDDDDNDADGCLLAGQMLG